MPSSSSHKALIRRYLIWAYKSTRESFERIERKTTQLIVDDFVMARLLKSAAKDAAGTVEFKKYIDDKRKDERKLKYDGKSFSASYVYLKERLAALEEAIKHFLGAKELTKIKAAFEAEFTRRIWESKDH